MAAPPAAPKAFLPPAHQVLASTGEWLRQMQATKWIAVSNAATVLLRVWDDPTGFMAEKSLEDQKVSLNLLRG